MERILPTQGMGWAEFQAFVQRLLIASVHARSDSPRLVKCADYGAQGQKQDGIDHLGTYDDGTVLAVQDKEVARLAPGQVKKIVGEATFDADRYVLAYSGVASAKVRDEVLNHPKWEIWDACDLLDRVLRLPYLDAARLLEQHWGVDTRRRFIDVAGVDHFLTVETYFHPWLQPSSRFHHATPYVGDQETVSEFVTALVSNVFRVVMLSGPGGQGKSRLLLEVLRRYEAEGTGMRVHVRSDHLPLEAAALRALDDDCVIVVEDVHREIDAFELLLGYVRRTPKTTLFATFRSSSAAAVNQAVARASFHTGEVFGREIGRLRRVQAERLVEVLIGNSQLAPGQARRLVVQAQELPFVAVVAIAMMQRDELTAAGRSDSDFRAEVLARYGTVVTEEVPGLDSTAVRSLLELIAALTPLNVADVETMDQIAEKLGTSRRTVMQRLDVLSAHGAVLVVGDHARVVPDVLADELFATAATVNGRDTGFVNDVWATFGDRHAKYLIDTVAELEWRLQRSPAVTGQAPPDLFGPVWSEVCRRVLNADCAQRILMLGYLSRTCVTQPRRVLDLLARVVARPAPESDLGSVWKVTHGKVLATTVSLIATSGMADKSSFGDALDLLWTIARRPVTEDSATANAQQALKSLATIRDTTWPIASEIIIEKVRRWLTDSTDDPTTVTPLFILEPLLEKAGSTTHQLGNKFRFSAHAIEPRVVAPLRNAVTDLLAEVVKTSSIRHSIEAIALLGTALREPLPIFGRQVPKDEVLGWEDDSLTIADALKTIAESATEPLHRLAVWEVVHWHSERAESPRVRALCLAVRTGIERRTDDDTITVCLAAPAWRRHAGATIDSIHEQKATERESAASLLWDLGTPQAIVNALTERIHVITEARRAVLGLDPLVQAVLDCRPLDAESLLDAVLDTPFGVLDSTIPILLNELARRHDTAFLTTLTRLMSSSDSGHAVAAISGFRIYDWISAIPASTQVLVTAADDPDPVLRSAAVRSLSGLLRNDSSALALLPRFLDQHHPDVREVIEMVYGHQPYERVNALNNSERTHLLSIVVTFDTDRFPFDQIITALALHDPAAVTTAISAHAVAGKSTSPVHRTCRRRSTTLDS